jgi:hypothetical protein
MHVNENNLRIYKMRYTIDERCGVYPITAVMFAALRRFLWE